MEGCRSGRTGRSRKALYLLSGTEGSNPSPSAHFIFNNILIFACSIFFDTLALAM